MKIALIGTHGTGKTTIAHELVANLKKSGIDAGFLGEIARTCPFPINENTTKKAQIWIMLTQITKEMEEEEKSSILICDRSVLDGYCYYFRKFGKSEVLENLVKSHIKTYDYIVKIPIRKDYLKKDKIRSTDKKFQQEIEDIIASMLKKFEVKYITQEELNKVLNNIKT